MITPFRSFPDEADHLTYIQYIRTNHAIPPLAKEPGNVTIRESFHPPLFYICASFFMMSDQLIVNARILRIFCLFLGMVGVWFIWKSAELIFPGDVPLCALATASAAFNMQFLWTHCGISNVSMTTLTSSLTFYLASRMLDENRNAKQDAIFLGVAMGLSLLSRVTTIYLLPICAIAIYYRSKNKLIPHLLLFIIAASLTAGWWYLRNWLYYGDPLLMQVYKTTMGQEWARDVSSLRIEELIAAPAFLHASFWAYFGRHEYHAAIADYAVYLVMVALSFAGVLEILRDRNELWENKTIHRKRFLLTVIGGCVAVVELMLMQFKFAMPMGRYLYMAYVPLGILFASGILKLFPAGKRQIASICFSSFLLVFGLYLLLRYAGPHYL